jgi:hypothetical protein
VHSKALSREICQASDPIVSVENCRSVGPFGLRHATFDRLLEEARAVTVITTTNMEGESRRSGRVAAKVAALPVPPPPPKPPVRGSRKSSRPSKPPPSALTTFTAATAAAAARKKKTKLSAAAKKKKERQNPKRKTLPNVLQDEDGEPVWIAPLLAADLKRAEKTGKHPFQHTKRRYLHTIASATVRAAVYERTAMAWADLEKSLLPSYGGRRWNVQVTIKDPINPKGHAVSPFFCFPDGGSLEVAAWPHWLLSIPHPPRFPGYTKHSAKAAAAAVGTVDDEGESQEEEVPEEEEEEDDEDMEMMQQLQEREGTPLTALALSERWRVPLPTYSLKWISPLRENFSSRKSAWEHAKTLCQQEVFLDKVIRGYHATGQPITKIQPPSAKTVLKAGNIRFLRDGLWVIGQEEVWQRERLAEMGQDAGEGFPLALAVVLPRKLSPLAFYIQENRKVYQATRQQELVTGDPSLKFTMREAETELRTRWKTLAEEEREGWAAQLQSTGIASLEVTQTPRQTASVTNEEAKEACVSLSGDGGLPGREVVDPECPVGRISPSSESELSLEQKSGPSSKVIRGSVVTPSAPHSPNSVSPESVDESEQDVVQSSKKVAADIVAPVAKVKSKPTVSSAWCLNAEQIQCAYDAGLDHFDTVIATVKAKDLVREFQDGFDVLRERGKGRYDMELPVFDTPEFSFLTNPKKTPWMSVVRQILGKDAVLIHKGMFLSLPGAVTQNYHQDGPHLTMQYQKPCHAVNVFIPLVDLKPESGPTEFCLGSHILGQEDYKDEFLETPLVKAGTPVIFDYRLGHMGLANSSGSPRPIVYCTYAAAADGKEFRDSVNFSRKRYHKIGDMVTKMPSREERAEKRQRVY